MTLLGGILTVKGVTFLMFSVLGIAALGYILGRVSIKGISLGTAGVFIVALLYGCFFYDTLAEQFTVGGITYVSNALKVIENMGLILFVSAVGFIAGPGFFRNFKKSAYHRCGTRLLLASYQTLIRRMGRRVASFQRRGRIQGAYVSCKCGDTRGSRYARCTV